jgi:hypothetical protein
LKCVDFSSKFAKEMDKIGVKYERIYLKSTHKDWNIYSEKLWKLISTNGNHNAIKIWDKIYDNINPKWININKWKEDLWFWWPSWPIFK